MSTALQIRNADDVRDAIQSDGEISVRDVVALAEMLVPTGFLPEHIKTAGQAAAIILTGRELGMAPMRALRSLTMVKGKVVENADSQLARFKSDGGRATFTSLDESGATLALQHPNGDEHVEGFTIEDAKRAGLLNNMGWQKYPKAMLRSRCITAGLKSIGWEGGTGTYDPEEAAAFTPQHGAMTPERTMSLDDANAFIVPVGKVKGQRLDTLTNVQLRTALHWTLDNDTQPKFQLALATVLDAQEKGSAPDAGAPQESPAGNTRTSELASPAPAAPPLELTSEPYEDPYPEAEPKGMSSAALQAEALRLLTHTSIGDALRKGYHEQIAAGLTHLQLQKTVTQLREMVAAAPPPRVKGKRYPHTLGVLPGDA